MKKTTLPPQVVNSYGRYVHEMGMYVDVCVRSDVHGSVVQSGQGALRDCR